MLQKDIGLAWLKKNLNAHRGLDPNTKNPTIPIEALQALEELQREERIAACRMGQALASHSVFLGQVTSKLVLMCHDAELGFWTNM